ncbi:hypothetical protein KIW84_035189 [Lathyrus oleraceus]|uniref:Uncharacterized protein n=1 Tax=Pisum sativum TaxID=3888 RepID=A0A9D4Y243_PEA|nr:hypothetical protein KIW84_035189 [Pisum sativum]
MHVPTKTSGSSFPTVRANKLLQMINPTDLVLDVSPLSTVNPPPQNKFMSYMAKNVKTLSKSSEPILPSKDKTVVEEESRSKGSKIRKPSMHVDGTENPTKTKRSAIDKELRSLDNDSSEKDEESIPQHADRERISKKKVDLVVNVEELTYDEEPLTNIVTPSVTKRLQRRKGKAVVFEDSPSREVKRKYGGLKGTSSRRSIGKSHIGPTRSWIKVDTPTGKRKFVSSSESGFDVKKDV